MTDESIVTYKGEATRVADLPAHLRRYYLRPEGGTINSHRGVLAAATARSSARAADAS